MLKNNYKDPGNYGTWSEDTSGVGPGRSPHGQGEAGRHQATDPGRSGRYQARPASDISKESQNENTTGRRKAKTTSRLENINSGLFDRPTNFVRFYIVSSTSGADLRKINLFKVDKQLGQYMGEPARISENHDKSLTIEVKNAEQGKKLLSLKTLVNEPIEVDIHQKLNESQGVITCQLLAGYSDEEIAEGLADEGVSKVYRIQKRGENNNTVPTNTLILTFATSTPPERIRIRAGYSERVRMYIPLPRRCYRCQQYGHVTKNCKNDIEICGNCGTKCDNNHQTKDCQKAPNCFHCQEPHPTSSKNCHKYYLEKEIIALKTKEHLTFREARMRIMELHPQRWSYSQAMKRTIKPPTHQNDHRSTEEQSTRPKTTKGTRNEHTTNDNLMKISVVSTNSSLDTSQEIFKSPMQMTPLPNPSKRLNTTTPDNEQKKKRPTYDWSENNAQANIIPPPTKQISDNTGFRPQTGDPTEILSLSSNQMAEDYSIYHTPRKKETSEKPHKNPNRKASASPQEPKSRSTTSRR